MKVLFELLCEELPASELLSLDRNLLENVLNKYNVEFAKILFFKTPRRIACEIECQPFSRQITQKIMGPPKQACFKDNKLTKALEAFLEKNGATENDIIFEVTPKGEYACINKKSQAITIKSLLCDIFKEFLNTIPFQKQMRWGSGEYSFSRPVHNIALFIDDEVLECEIFGLKSTTFTFGHRFLSNGQINLAGADYRETLKKHSVIVDFQTRKQMIANALDELSTSEYTFEKDEMLLKEVANLVEYPNCLVGTFDESFLRLPQEVLITSMKVNQRYFPAFKDGKLTNKFVAVANIITNNENNVIKGYERVIKARFRDASFFFEEDLKVPLESLVEKLQNMVFHEKLGSMYDKTLRLVNLSEYLANLLDANTKLCKEAAYLSKADLLSAMVYEFPEVQGIMGMHYARLQGKHTNVSRAIFEQYLPKEDDYPTSKEGIVLSLADKIDLIAGGFLADLKPTGNKDPYALRRAALSIIKIILHNKLSFSLSEVFDLALMQYSNLVDNTNQTCLEIIDFMKQRFINMYDDNIGVVKAVVEVGFDNVLDVSLKIESLRSFYTNTDQAVLFAIKRIFNIVPDRMTETAVDTRIFTYEQELTFYNYINSVYISAEDLMNKKDYKGALELLLSNTQVISDLFDKVLIMDKDEKIKQNRLSLLNNFKQSLKKIADFKYLTI